MIAKSQRLRKGIIFCVFLAFPVILNYFSPALAAMSIDVNSLVQAQRMENTECILCGRCADVCPNSVITYSFSKG